MSKALKRMIAADLKSRLGEDRSMVVVQLDRLTVEKANDLRGKLREEGARMTVLRNRVAAKVFDELGLEGLADVPAGMSAIAHGRGDEGVLDVSRVLTSWAKGNKEHTIHVLGGFMDGRVLTADDVGTLATMPSRDDLLAMIASAVVAPVQNIAAQVNELLVGVARAVDAVREQKEQAG